MAARPAGSDRFAKGVAGAGGIFFAVAGLWALFAPRSFFDTLAVFEPYNEHFVHDIGAFQVGLGAVLLLAVFLWDALLVALAGVAVGSAAHLLAHAMDTALGGNPAQDIPFFAVLTVLLAAGAVARAGVMRHGPAA